MSHQGNKMKRVITIRGRTKMGEIVQIFLKGADSSKGNNKILALVLVEAKLHSKEPH